MPEPMTQPAGAPSPLPFNVDPKALIDTALRVLTRQPAFWESVRGEAGLKSPLTFAVAMGVVAGAIAGVIGFVGNLLHGAILDAVLGLIATLVVYPIIAAVGVVVGGAVVHVLVLVLGGTPNFETSARIAGYGAVVLPLGAAVGVVGLVSPSLSSLLQLAPAFYGLYLAALGIHALHGTDKRKLLIVCAVLAGLALLGTVVSLVVASASRAAAAEFNANAPAELQDFLDEAKKQDYRDTADALKELQKTLGGGR